MKILSIESSCDETAAAVVQNGKNILSNIVASSQNIHADSGGIIPETAAREQVKHILPVIQKALLASQENQLKDKKVKTLNSLSKNALLFSQIDALAVTSGPGLVGSLLVGLETAKTLSIILDIPVVPVNHVIAHIYANWLNKIKSPSFPAISLVVSGGHTELFYIKKHGEYKWIGGTLDDAAGEAFDKSARLLGLSYPGGPSIAKKAARLSGSYHKSLINLPRPMLNSKDLNFSFSGLKTAVSRKIEQLKNTNNFDNKNIIALANEIQESITDVLVEKTITAADKYKASNILLGGGVAANKRLSQKLSKKVKKIMPKTNLYIPPASFCTDNAAYIASYAYYNYKPVPALSINPKPNLDIDEKGTTKV